MLSGCTLKFLHYAAKIATNQRFSGPDPRKAIDWHLGLGYILFR